MTHQQEKTQSIPRLLTESEKTFILEFVPLNPAVPLDVARFEQAKIRESYATQLDTIRLHPSLIPNFRQRMERKFYECAMQPGTSLGVICAQSIGEKATQQTLNVFHKAGQIETMVVDAIPRFKELVNVTRCIRNPLTTLSIDGSIVERLGIEEVKRRSLSQLVHTTFGHVVKSYTFESTFHPRPWHALFESIYGPTFARRGSVVFDRCICIAFVPNPEILCATFTEFDTIRTQLLQDFGDLECLFSPSMDELLVLVPKYNAVDDEDLFEEFVRSMLVPLLKKTKIAGCKGVTHISFDRDAATATNDAPTPLVLSVEGGSFNDLIRFPLADATKTLTNSIVDVHAILGIEATKNFLKDEFGKVLEGINRHHISLLTNFMTFTGIPISLTRFTMRKCKGVLTRASFEETMDNFTNSAVAGMRDNLAQVSASIIMGKTMQMGSGLCQIRQKILPTVEEEGEVEI